MTVAVLLLALSVSAQMNRAECKKNCKRTVDICEKTCKEHAKNPRSIRKCKQNCKKFGKVCVKQCNKRQ
jgi:hypothetical protein